MIEVVWVNTGIVVAGLLIGYGRLSNKVATKKEVSEKLYHKDGTPIYMSRSECRHDREDCNTRICKKLEAIESAMQTHSAEHQELSRFVGRVEERLK